MSKQEKRIGQQDLHNDSTSLFGRLNDASFDFSPDDQAVIAETLSRIDETLMDFLLPAHQVFLDGFKNPNLTIGKKIDDDSPAAYVTAADSQIESSFREWAKTHFPDHSVYGEEEGRNGDEKFDWRIDPIDGTKNYANGIPESSIVVALCYKGTPVFAAVDLPHQNKLYIAHINRGIQLNGQPITKTGKTDTIKIVVNAFRNEARKQEAIGELGLPPENIYTKTSTLCEVTDVLSGQADVGVWCEVGEHEWPAAVLLARENGNVVWELDKQGPFDLTSKGTRDFAIARNEETFQITQTKIHKPVSP